MKIKKTQRENIAKIQELDVKILPFFLKKKKKTNSFQNKKTTGEKPRIW